MVRALDRFLAYNFLISVLSLAGNQSLVGCRNFSLRYDGGQPKLKKKIICKMTKVTG